MVCTRCDLEYMHDAFCIADWTVSPDNVYTTRVDVI